MPPDLMTSSRPGKRISRTIFSKRVREIFKWASPSFSHICQGVLESDSEKHFWARWIGRRISQVTDPLCQKDLIEERGVKYRSYWISKRLEDWLRKAFNASFRSDQ